jgi:hypothetical protein
VRRRGAHKGALAAVAGPVFWLVFWLGGALPAAAAGAVTVFKATVEPAVIGLGETATLTIEVRSSHLSSIHFRPDFKLDNLELASGASAYDNVQITNGSFSRSYRMVWRVRPIGLGKAAVRSVSLQIGDELIHIPDREITVQEAPTGQAGEEPGDAPEDPFGRIFGGPLERQPEPPRRPAVFLRAEVQPEHPYVGQQVLYTIYLYTRDDISSMAAREMPTFRGFWVHDVPQPQHLPTDMVSIGNERYGRVAVVQKALFPIRPGRYTIEPASMDLIARVVESRWFGPPLSRPEQVTLKTPPMPVDVQPLPPAPRGFAGAVGQLALNVHLEPAQLRLGEAATLTVTLAGHGNVQGVGQPQITPPAGLEIFPPQQQGDERVVGTSVEGNRTWSWVVVPRQTGRATLKVPEIPFFDPQSGQYRVASAPPLEVTTLPPAIAATSAGPLQSIRDTASRPLLGGGALSWPRLLPWLFAVPCGIVLIITLARRRRQEALASPAAFSAGHAAQAAPPPAAPDQGAASARVLAERRLREAAAEGRPRQAAARIEEAWREFLARRWDIPPATPSPRWGEALRACGADPEVAAELLRLADDLHYLRYAPQLSATEMLSSEAISRSRRLLRRLR